MEDVEIFLVDDLLLVSTIGYLVCVNNARLFPLAFLTLFNDTSLLLAVTSTHYHLSRISFSGLVYRTCKGERQQVNRKSIFKIKYFYVICKDNRKRIIKDWNILKWDG